MVISNQKLTPTVTEIIEQKIESFFQSSSPQIIWDNLGQEQIKTKAIKSKLKAECVISFDLKSYGFPEENSRNRKAFNRVNNELCHIKNQLINQVKSLVKRWHCKYPQEIITYNRIQAIEQVFDTFLTGTTQVSQHTFLWLTKYALFATSCHNREKEGEEYRLTVSVGGDTTPPPYVEAYFLPVIKILKQLKKLQNPGIICQLPRLSLIFSYPSQVIENHRDKQGNLINPALHYYNSQVTIFRIHAFISYFFPEIAAECEFIVFPAYHKYSLERLFFAVTWQAIPMEAKILEKLFLIKGNVVDAQQQQEDLLYSILGAFNAYVPRHMFTNLMVSNAHTLRFGSRLTEKQFHLTNSSLVPILKDNPYLIMEKIQQGVRKLAAMLSETKELANSSAVDFILQKQFQSLPPISKIHAQIGIPIPAAYYKNQSEPSLPEIIGKGEYRADLIRQQNPHKASLMEKAFYTVADEIGLTYYLDFLALWNQEYLYQAVDDSKMMAKLHSQAETLQKLTLSTALTRKLLNYWLFSPFTQQLSFSNICTKKDILSLHDRQGGMQN